MRVGSNGAPVCPWSAKLKFGAQVDNVGLSADYQLLAARGDRLSLQNKLPASPMFPATGTDDRYRLMHLTHDISQDDDSIVEAVQELVPTA